MQNKNRYFVADVGADRESPADFGFPESGADFGEVYQEFGAEIPISFSEKALDDLINSVTTVGGIFAITSVAALVFMMMSEGSGGKTPPKPKKKEKE
jgi:hypothetical protein